MRIAILGCDWLGARCDRLRLLIAGSGGSGKRGRGRPKTDPFVSISSTVLKEFEVTEEDDQKFFGSQDRNLGIAAAPKSYDCDPKTLFLWFLL